MLIKIPLRISFIGGGTDIAPAFLEKDGLAISATFDKYVHVGTPANVPNVDAFQDMKEKTKTFYNEFEHPIFQPKTAPYNLNIASEIVPGSGLGTSSAIAVALIVAMFNLNIRQRQMTPFDVANLAITFEREWCGIEGGIQDQYIASFPGLNKFEFSGEIIEDDKPNNKYSNIRLKTKVSPYHHYLVNRHRLSSKLLLVDTGIIRRQANIMNEQINATIAHKITDALDKIRFLTQWFDNHLIKQDWYELGKVVSESWGRKKELNPNINIPEVDQILKDAQAISYGGKLLGAGGGGYVLLICADREETNFFLTAKGYRTILPNIVNRWSRTKIETPDTDEEN